jgi:hypothetical protein
VRIIPHCEGVSARLRDEFTRPVLTSSHTSKVSRPPWATTQPTLHRPFAVQLSRTVYNGSRSTKQRGLPTQTRASALPMAAAIIASVSSVSAMRRLWLVITEDDARRGVVPTHLVDRPLGGDRPIRGNDRTHRAQVHPRRSWIGSPYEKIVLHRHRVGAIGHPSRGSRSVTSPVGRISGLSVTRCQ